jgi:hypothetical protein
MLVVFDKGNEDQLHALSAQQVLAKASGLALNAKPIPRM